MKTTTELKKIMEGFYNIPYQMLSRFKMDCDYFLGFGNCCEKHLWAGNVEDHIELMKMLYDFLPEKPEWLTFEQIEEYSERMLSNNWYNLFSAFEWQEDDSFICKASKEALESIDTQNLMIALCWENDLDFSPAGEDGCMNNYDMYTPLYSYKTDKLYLVPHSQAEKWKRGEVIQIFGKEMDDEERKYVEKFMNQ